MKSTTQFLISTLALIISPTALALSLTEQCLLGVPKFEGTLVEGSINELPVSIDSDKLVGQYPTDAIFIGNVKLMQGNGTLTTDKLHLVQNEDVTKRTATATGNVFYGDNLVQLRGDSAFSDLLNRDTDVINGSYEMVGKQGRGKAETMEVRDNSRFTVLKNGSFTSCLQGDNSWSVSGTTIIHDKTEEVAKVFNAVVRVGPVPVFYSPYLELPLGDRRRSGFLLPSFRYSSSNDFEFTIPYYWNIAPNFDATISPHYISARGLQLQNEFRYLLPVGQGLVQADYLKDDKLFKDDRWLLYWQHAGVFNKVWRFNADYTRVSDKSYFTDLETQYGNSTSGYATQNVSVGYADKNWDLSLSSTRFQLFSDSAPSAYRSEPRIDVNYYQTELEPLDIQVYGQFVQFKNENKRNPNISRWHVQPTVDLPLSNGWASLNNQVSLMSTYYNYSIDDKYWKDEKYWNRDAKSYSRTLPQYKADARITFERRFGENQSFTQTLEPRAQYLYIPFRDQSDIINLDSALLQNDTIGLFRDRIYSGIDRIASSNLVATGVTSRIYDKNANERFNFSLGQIYHFSKQRTDKEPDAPKVDKNADLGSVTWAADTMFKLNDFWGIRGGLQYDTRYRAVALANSVLEFKKDKDRLVQASYRYANSDYITATLDRNNPRYLDGISQLGAVASWPIAEKVALVGRIYYDTNYHKPAEQFAGLQYNTCCWGVGVSYERKIVGWEFNSSNYDEKISLIFQINGLGREINLGSQDMLAEGILPYRRAF